MHSSSSAASASVKNNPVHFSECNFCSTRTYNCRALGLCLSDSRWFESFVFSDDLVAVVVAAAVDAVVGVTVVALQLDPLAEEN